MKTTLHLILTFSMLATVLPADQADDMQRWAERERARQQAEYDRQRARQEQNRQRDEDARRDSELRDHDRRLRRLEQREEEGEL